ncbi:MAG: hypothetical protein BGO98_13475 [Myxococcales bacterium 68-20]|nr:MAG: hypothetical protein BGO98_13475 [Myxococcales bacterium 68-20]
MRWAHVLRAGCVVVLVLGAAGACGDDRTSFTQREEVFQIDASTEAAVCGFQCSVDGRSIVDTCTDEVVETCPPELACGAARCQEPCAAAAADRSSNGCEFYFQLPAIPNDPRAPQSCFAAFVVNTSMQPLELSLEREGKVLDLSKALFRTNPGDASLLPLEGPVPAGESAILFVADQTGEVALATTWFDHKYQPCPVGVVPALVADFATGTRFDASFHLKANVPASVVTMYPWGGAASYVPSATLLFPPATWGKEHVIVNAWESATTGVPSAQIVASEDGTEVTLDPTEDVQGGLAVKGTAARVPTTYHLDKGEFLQLVQSRELTGSVVVSNKPTTVFGGHSCMMVPSSKAACEVANQQLPPFEQWGHEYVGVGYRPRVGNEHETMYYRIVAARDGTVLDYDPAPPPGAPIAMSARQAVTFTSGVGDAFVVRTQDAEHAIYLAAYMANGQDVGGYGDPEFVNVVPAGQYLSSYSFYADPTYAETSLVVVRAKAAKARGANFEDVWLECAGDLTGWKPIGTRGDYEFMRVDLARGHGAGDRFGDKVCQNGLQRMRSTGPFTATLWGWDKYASYAYPGGMAQRKLVTTPLVSVQ